MTSKEREALLRVQRNHHRVLTQLIGGKTSVNDHKLATTEYVAAVDFAVGQFGPPPPPPAPAAPKKKARPAGKK